MLQKVFFRKANGYFTVEASMLMPLVLSLIALIFYLTFYLYDRCVISQDVYILAFRGALQCGKGGADIEQYIQSESASKYGSKYIGVDNLESNVWTGDNSVAVEATGIMATTHWKFTARKEVERICPVEFIRKMRLAQRIGEKLEMNKEK